MLLPGFTVRQLPVDLPNINNVRFRHDGKLVALGYNGNVYLLSDSDGDGLEDRVDLLWENKGQLRSPIGMALTPPGYPQGQGVFVASKGKVSLLLYIASVVFAFVNQWISDAIYVSIALIWLVPDPRIEKRVGSR